MWSWPFSPRFLHPILMEIGSFSCVFLTVFFLLSLRPFRSRLQQHIQQWSWTFRLQVQPNAVWRQRCSLPDSERRVHCAVLKLSWNPIRGPLAPVRVSEWWIVCSLQHNSPEMNEEKLTAWNVNHNWSSNMIRVCCITNAYIQTHMRVHKPPPQQHISGESSQKRRIIREYINGIYYIYILLSLCKLKMCPLGLHN